MTPVNGQPPHMIAAQNVMTTETMLHMASIGVGGLTPAADRHEAHRGNDDAHGERRQRQHQALGRLAGWRDEPGVGAPR